MPGLLALGAVAWGGLVIAIARHHPRPAPRLLEPIPVATAASRIGRAMIALATAGIASGVVIAIAQSGPASRAGSMNLVIPIAVTASIGVLGAALLALAWADVATGARRALAFAGVLALWLTTCLATQTLSDIGLLGATCRPVDLPGGHRHG